MKENTRFKNIAEKIGKSLRKLTRGGGQQTEKEGSKKTPGLSPVEIAEMEAIEESPEKEERRKALFQKLIVFGVIALFLVAALFSMKRNTREEMLQADGISIAGIPFSEILAKISEEEAYTGNVIPAAEDETAVEVNKEGTLKVTYSLAEHEALIFDRDGLSLEKIDDDFIVSDYATSNVYLNKDNSAIYCKNADSIARVLRFNLKNGEMILIWENDLIYDKILPVNAILNISKFNIANTKPIAGDIFDESMLLVEIETGKKVHIANVELGETQVLIIQSGKDDFQVISRNYIDKNVSVEGANHYSVPALSRILVYDYEQNLIELVYQ